MGIKDLWTILGPFCERKPLYELQGKTVAIDLSCWICEAQTVLDYQIQPRMYLRNLYFRTCYLLLLDVNPVFVLEGKAPTLKYSTIAARNAIQFKGSKPRTEKTQGGKDRSRFNFTLKRCEEMLQFMGLACITGSGEAEAMCAYLNEDGLVEGCISQDSDCFAYGAKRVYRNFSISQQGTHSASGGAVDIYDVEKLNKSNGFGRNKIIALALLCGSDYSDGVHGIGKDSAIKLFNQVSDEDILERLRSWRSNAAFYEDLDKKISDKNTCSSCGHFGRLQSHNKIGCKECGMSKGCDASKYKDERLAIKNELNIRSKALQDVVFPNETLIREFLVRKDNVVKLNLNWKLPDLINFVKFTVKFLQWEELYAFEKFLPILTRWQVVNYKAINDRIGKSKLKGILYPDYIKKVRNPKGVPSYEIIWADKDALFANLIPPEQLVDVVPHKLWSTIEPQHLVQKAYPELVEAYLQSKVKPKKPSKQKKKDPVDELGNLLHNTSISEPKAKNTKKETKRKPKKKNEVEDLENSFGELNINRKPAMVKQKTIDSYLKKAIINSMDKENLAVESKVCGSLVDSFDLDLSNFGDENDLDLSDIIDDIVNRDLPRYITENLHKFPAVVDGRANTELQVLEIEGGFCNSVSGSPSGQEECLNRSSFFVTNPVEDDLFEKIFDKSITNSDDTEEYEFDENILANLNENKNCRILNSNADKSNLNEDDSFSVNYVPLIERLRKKK